MCGMYGVFARMAHRELVELSAQTEAGAQTSIALAENWFEELLDASRHHRSDMDVRFAAVQNSCVGIDPMGRLWPFVSVNFSVNVPNRNVGFAP